MDVGPEPYGDEPLFASPPLAYPCVRCGAEVGVPLFDLCDACETALIQAEWDRHQQEVAP